jgi:hypothetical protein
MRRAKDESPPSEVAAVLKGHRIFLEFSLNLNHFHASGENQSIDFRE